MSFSTRNTLLCLLSLEWVYGDPFRNRERGKAFDGVTLLQTPRTTPNVPMHIVWLRYFITVVYLASMDGFPSFYYIMYILLYFVEMTQLTSLTMTDLESTAHKFVWITDWIELFADIRAKLQKHLSVWQILGIFCMIRVPKICVTRVKYDMLYDKVS